MTKTLKKKKKIFGINLTPLLIIAGVIGIILTLFIIYRATFCDRKLFSISTVAIFAGVVFESLRVSDNWRKVIGIFIGAYLLSLFGFLPGKNEQFYNFDNHIQFWPYAFILIFTLLFVVVHKERVTANLTEGITLLLSISIIYWAFDYGFINFDNTTSILLITIGFLFSVFSIINSLTRIQLSKTIRLLLSTWSTIVMFSFAIDNILRVFNNPKIEDSKYLSEGLYIGIQYFLLGVSAVYVMNNYMLLAGFLPSKNGNYKDELKENIREHIERYSDEQVSIRHSLFCIVYCIVIYLINYKYQILPRHTMIWLVFLTFPIILQLITLLEGQKNYR